MGNDADLAAADFGYYGVSTLDTRTHRWVEVASGYNPSTRMLVTELWHFSWWSTVKAATPAAQIAAECLVESLRADTGSVDVGSVSSFLSCLGDNGVTTLNSAFETRILTDLLPKTCWAALVTAGITSGKGPAIIPVLASVLTNTPACNPVADSGGIPAPTISKVSTDSGPAGGGTTVTITGWMFAIAKSVTFGARPAADITIDSNNTITAVAPSGSADTVDVRVSDGGAVSAATPSDRYTYTAPGTAPVSSPTSPTGVSPSQSGSSSWTASEVPLPGNAGGSDVTLSGEACPSSSQCIAVGSYTDASGYGQGLLLSGYGTSWTETQAPLPPDATGGTLTGVACYSPTQCVGRNPAQQAARTRADAPFDA